jgi:glutamate decarboxylase
MLHGQDEVDDQLLDGVLTSTDPAVSMPKYRLPAKGQDPRNAFQVVTDELMLDGNSRQNLATFCQTWLEPEVHRIMDLTLDKNMIDKDEYPQTAELEERCVHMLADLWNSPEASTTIGTSTTGSSEAAMLGGLALLRNWRARRRASGTGIARPNLVTGPAQICWHKFTRYWDVEHREIPMEGRRLTMDADEVLARVDENTIGVVPTLGLTFTGEYEPVEEVSEALDDFAAETGIDVPIHVDGASGGFVAPFTVPDLVWDFRLPRVKSINVSGHKFGLAPLGVGWIVWRDVAELPEELVFHVNYLGGTMPTFALNFSRSGGPIVAQYYNFLRLGREGYRKIQLSAHDTAMFLAEEIGDLGPFEIVFDGNPRNGIPALSWTLEGGGAGHTFTLFDLADRLRTRGWLVPAYTMPPNRQDMTVQRIIVRHGFSHELATLLVNDYRHALDYFDAHPVATPLTEREAGSFNHGVADTVS